MFTLRHITIVVMLALAGVPLSISADQIGAVIPVPEKYVAISGDYYSAIELAVAAWRLEDGRKFRLLDQVITVQPHGSDLEVRIVPKPVKDMLGGANRFGDENIYIVRQRSRRILAHLRAM